jgi:hypothetical protein
MINVIQEDEEIRLGLFPPPGANASTTKGGGKVAIDYHMKFCDILFGDHDIYGDRVCRQ